MEEQRKGIPTNRQIYTRQAGFQDLTEPAASKIIPKAASRRPDPYVIFPGEQAGVM